MFPNPIPFSFPCHSSPPLYTLSHAVHSLCSYIPYIFLLKVSAHFSFSLVTSLFRLRSSFQPFFCTLHLFFFFFFFLPGFSFHSARNTHPQVAIPPPMVQHLHPHVPATLLSLSLLLVSPPSYTFPLQVTLVVVSLFSFPFPPRMYLHPLLFSLDLLPPSLPTCRSSLNTSVHPGMFHFFFPLSAVYPTHFFASSSFSADFYFFFYPYFLSIPASLPWFSFHTFLCCTVSPSTTSINSSSLVCFFISCFIRTLKGLS